MTEPKFIPHEGQVDYTDIRYCPVINCVVRHDGKILLVRRSQDLRLHPGYWNGISGFLDSHQSIEEKVHEELCEELGIGAGDIASIRRGPVLVQEAEEYRKTWIVFPILVEISHDHIELDWEAAAHRWVTPADARTLKLLPGFAEVLQAVLDQK